MARTPLEQDIDGANTEISRIMITMFMGVYFIGGLVVLAYMLVVRNDQVELARVAGLCGVSLMFAVALGHHTSERISGWLRFVEFLKSKQAGNLVMSWEKYKKGLRSRVLVPVLDVGMATAPLYVTWKFAWILWVADSMFAAVTGTGLVVAMVLNWVGLKYADR